MSYLLENSGMTSLRDGRLRRGCFLAALVVAGVAGYVVRVAQENTISRLEVRHVAGLEFYLSEPSFCEIENAKGTLDGACARVISELRARCNPSVLKFNGNRNPRDREVHVFYAIREVEANLERFKGTEQELVLTQELLLLLKHVRQYDRWLEVYLRTLYEHPTHRVVARFAEDAREIGQAAGQIGRVRSGFEHRAEIPIDWPGRALEQMECSAAGSKKLSPGAPHEATVRE